MIISYQWLRDYVDFDLTPAELCEKLTNLGLEAYVASQYEPFLNEIVIGEVIECVPHPNSDHLSICQVKVNADSIQQIVCGAPNVAQGQRVPVALQGTTLPGGLEIKPVKLRGEKSNGMICSERELGLSESHDGILILNDTAPVGGSFVDYLTGGDTAIEIDLTPNRPDAMSHIGVARDLAALIKQTLAKPKPEFRESAESTDSSARITLEDTHGCPRYATRVIRGVTIGPSPKWLQERLQAVGLRSINNVVDAANFVLMETGHPLHTFDYDQLAGHEIIVRRAYKNEKMTTLDSKERQLNEEILLICDGEKPVAIAGIMGGENSEVMEQTTNILIESAYFDPVTIRRGAKFLGLSSEASKRFERGADPSGVIYALERLTGLIQELAGGQVSKGVVDAYPKPISPAEVRLRYKRCSDLLGVDIPAETQRQILTDLGMETLESSDQETAFRIPTFRPDITREADLFEEILRVYGQHNVPVNTHFRVTSQALGKSSNKFRNALREIMVGMGYHEIMSVSLVMENQHPRLFGDEKPVELLNPSSREMTTVRSSLLPGMETALAYNRRHRQNNIHLFEVGQVSTVDKNSDTSARESTHIAFLQQGLVQEKTWLTPEIESTFYHLKGDLSKLWRSLTGDDPKFVTVDHAILKHCYGILLDGEIVGYLGELPENRLENLDISGNVFYAEITTAALEKAYWNREKSFILFSPYPVVERDLSLVIDETISHAEIQKVIEEKGGNFLQESYLYDLYQGNTIATGQKSLTFRLVFQTLDRTLTEREVDQAFDRIVWSLKTDFNANLR
ncbi:MAG: phenylalanine--tRNA ligase subunit beta [Candidatus Marinimicrobia bacterium]|nr:phenylalanine--tRNA ligase subunit beta [Candidatus Neomarinimicrobiota bacterium]MCF7840373.1 phenylalanine--tRNA ligase subunit beta [Candidatus Neomarinimicrobiota bacterium]